MPNLCLAMLYRKDYLLFLSFYIDGIRVTWKFCGTHYFFNPHIPIYVPRQPCYWNTLICIIS